MSVRVRVTRTAQASRQGDLAEGGERIGVELAGTEISLEAGLAGD
jgi:hypothetical protein